MKKNNKKGFTLAELLIVVAIIAVLVAIAIPVFTTSLDDAKNATANANLRAAKAEAAVAYLESDGATKSGEIKLDENGALVTYNWTYNETTGVIDVTKASSGS